MGVDLRDDGARTAELVLDEPEVFGLLVEIGPVGVPAGMDGKVPGEACLLGRLLEEVLEPPGGEPVSPLGDKEMVLGFLPVRAFRFATEKVPKPVRVILPPFLRSLVMLSVIESIACAAAVLVILASMATAEIRSALVMGLPP